MFCKKNSIIVDDFFSGEDKLLKFLNHIYTEKIVFQMNGEMLL